MLTVVKVEWISSTGIPSFGALYVSLSPFPLRCSNTCRIEDWLDVDRPELDWSRHMGLEHGRVMLFGQSSLPTNDEASSYSRQSSPITCKKYEHQVIKGHQVGQQRKQRWSVLFHGHGAHLRPHLWEKVHIKVWTNTLSGGRRWLLRDEEAASRAAEGEVQIDVCTPLAAFWPRLDILLDT